MLIAIVPLIACVAGILIYVLSSHTKVMEMGRLMYFAGLLVTLFVMAQKTVKF